MMYLEHILAAVALQLAVGFLTRNWWAGAALASAYFIGREIGQAEYRWIEKFGHGLRANMPWWGPFDLRVWSKADQWIDWIGPVLSTCTLAHYMNRKRSPRLRLSRRRKPLSEGAHAREPDKHQ